MKILIDSKGMHSKGGIGRDSVYTLEFIMESLSSLHPEIEYLSKSFPTFSRKYVTLRGLLKFGIAVPKQKVDVFVENNFSGRRVKNEKIWHIIRVHDIFPISNPEWFRRIACKVFINGITTSFNHEKTIYICNSLTTRANLVAFNSTLEKKTMVLYCNPNHISNFNDTECQCKGCAILTNLNDDSPYFVMVGTIEPRKNYEFILNVLHKYQLDFNIIVIGRPGWKSKKIQKLLRNDSKVNWIPNCCDFALRNIYLKAIAFLSTSHDEGFNLPAAEAVVLGKNIVLPKSRIYDELYGQSYFEYSDESELITQLSSLNHFQTTAPKFEFDQLELKERSKKELLRLIQS